MILLGLCDNHDSGACIFKDGELVFAVNEERLSRKKLQGGFPWLSIVACLEGTGIKPSEIDRVVLASLMTPTAGLRFFDGWHDTLRQRSSSFSYGLNAYILYQTVYHRLKFLERSDSFFSKRIIASRIAKIGIRAPISCIDHHEAHAAGAYYLSGDSQRTVIITLDAMGDGVSVTVSLGEGSHVRRVYEQPGLCAISTYYQRLTEILGFAPLRHEGKITSLAAYGRFNEKVLEIAKQCLSFSGQKQGFQYKNYIFPENRNSFPYKKLENYSREDIAFNFQKNFEDEITKFCVWWIKKLKVERLALAGGIFANVSLNQRMKEIQGIRQVYVLPHMGDGGLAVGGVLALLRPEPNRLKTIYLGPRYDNSLIRSLLETQGVSYFFLEEEALRERVADSLAQGKTVGHFDGRMEWGPRALGNRSILYRADDPSVMEWLNKKMDRSSFMPFAPVTLDLEAEDFYENIEAVRETQRFMTVAVDCTEKMKTSCPAAVHVDGTARPQILSRGDNPRLYGILEYYRKRTGVGTILNTSFNRHEEPIVCSPEDAVKSFKECNLDLLVLNNYLVVQR